jgi:putative tryptophan/tyrosine transport system substrate-binding protein
MKRREFITLLGGAAAAWPLAAWAQRPGLPVVGYISSIGSLDTLSAFRRGLNEAGYIDGKNVIVEFPQVNDRYDQLRALAGEFVDRGVSVLVASGNNAAVAAKAVTATIPIVFMTGLNVVEAGLVTSLSRPGGNVTGVTTLSTELAPKRLEVIHELLPNTQAFALLLNPANANAETVANDMQAAAGRLGLQLHILHASTEPEVESAFARLQQLRPAGLVIGADAFFTNYATQLGLLTARYSLPAIFQYRDFAAGGGLMSYGSSLTDAFRLVGIYAARVLKGEKPADLPVQQATRIELILNLNAAKALGITVPITLLGRADEVIE